MADCSLPEPFSTWKSNLCTLFLGRIKNDQTQIKEYLESDVFEKVSESELYSNLLNLYDCMPDKEYPKPHTLAGLVFEIFDDWLQRNVAKVERHNIGDDVRLNALRIFTAYHTIHLNRVDAMFNLKLLSINVIKEHVASLLTQRKHVIAAKIVIFYEIRHLFEMKDILIPILLYDRRDLLEEYLEDQVKMQSDLTSLLDAELVRERDNRTEVHRFTRMIQNFNPAELNSATKHLRDKSVQKLVYRLVQTYGLPNSICPNLTRIRNEGSLKYLFYKRFGGGKNNMTEEGWADMVDFALHEYPSLIKLLIQLLCQKRMFEEVAYWATKFDVPKGAIPYNIIPMIPLYEFPFLQKRPETPPGDYLKLPRGFDTKIHWINTSAGVEKMMNSLESNQELLIGIDCEWRPAFGQSLEMIALMQLCTRECAFLVDLLILSRSLTPDQLKSFISRLFCSPKLRKIGFGFESDLKMLESGLPSASSTLKDICGFLELQRLIKNMESDRTGPESPQKADEAASCSAPTENDACEFEDGGCGLAGVCKKYLGKVLDKREQMGNWAKRPLRNSQIEYATLDAYCLLDIYEYLQDECSRRGIDFEKKVGLSLTTNKGKEKKKNLTYDPVETRLKTISKAQARHESMVQLVKTINEEFIAEGGVSNDVDTFKFINDRSLISLGRDLCRLGVDAYSPDGDEPLNVTLTKAVRERRIFIVNKGARRHLDYIRNRLREDYICLLPDRGQVNRGQKNAVSEHLKFVLSKYHIAVKDSDILSRCVLCNNSELLLIPRPFMQVLYASLVQPKAPYDPKPFDRHAEKLKLFQEMDRIMNEKLVQENLDMIWKKSITLKMSLQYSILCDNVNSWVVQFNGGCVDLLTGMINEGPVFVSAEGAALPDTQRSMSFMYYVCTKCGRIYFDGKDTVRLGDKCDREDVPITSLENKMQDDTVRKLNKLVEL